MMVLLTVGRVAAAECAKPDYAAFNGDEAAYAEAVEAYLQCDQAHPASTAPLPADLDTPMAPTLADLKAVLRTACKEDIRVWSDRLKRDMAAGWSDQQSYTAWLQEGGRNNVRSLLLQLGLPPGIDHVDELVDVCDQGIREELKAS
ncbi:hypothetical protein N8I74_17925 [Chitiniphilus purpureus]|uniref:Lysozyme inhibitor LprI N-terminal domain-containing protein n=1 Tax=Chitiniphilus purpureus TaxID=2981137 RepID=A0ABY6DMD5_9NEIS|nr:hypothetical protein [Chitiniphilus sp. CD1]UXY15167.1 hypothetical protein N8I74_17925 [Chitiniphilus sp. CD1]